MCPPQISGNNDGQISLAAIGTRWPLTSVVSSLSVVFTQFIALVAIYLEKRVLRISKSLRHVLGLSL